MLHKFAILTLFLLLSTSTSSDKASVYQKDYFSNGKLKSKGWLTDGYKSGYWYFYRKNGHLEKEGHYLNDKMNNWWIFYDQNGVINHKCQLSSGRKNGYCLKYHNDRLNSASKFADGKKIKEWYDLSSFKKENKLSDLK